MKNCLRCDVCFYSFSISFFKNSVNMFLNKALHSIKIFVFISSSRCWNFSDLIGRTKCNLIASFSRYWGKTNLEVLRNLNANTALSLLQCSGCLNKTLFNGCSKLAKVLSFYLKASFIKVFILLLKLRNWETTGRYLCSRIKFRRLDRETRSRDITLPFYIAHFYIANVVFFTTYKEELSIEVFNFVLLWLTIKISLISQPAIICLKLTTETLGQGVKYVLS